MSDAFMDSVDVALTLDICLATKSDISTGCSIEQLFSSLSPLFATLMLPFEEDNFQYFYFVVYNKSVTSS